MTACFPAFSALRRAVQALGLLTLLIGRLFIGSTPALAASSTTTLTVTPAGPVTLYDGVTLRATVSGSGGTPTGVVRFFSGITLLGTANLGNGVGTISTSNLRGGVHSLSAEYDGSTLFDRSASSNVMLTVNRDPTRSVLTVPQIALPGAAIPVSVRVSTVQPAGFGPTGAVAFRRETTTIGTANLVQGVASFNVKGAPFGYSWIGATYNGSTDFLFSNADPKLVLVTYAQGTADFRINAGAAFDQNSPAASRLGSGAIVVFRSQASANGLFGIRGRFITAGGSPVGGDLTISLPAAGLGAPHVAALTNGDFVVVWSQTVGSAGRDILMRRFSPAGAPRGLAVRVNNVTAGDQTNPQVAALPNGQFTVVWQSPGIEGKPANGVGIAQRRYLHTGMPASGQTLVNSILAGNQTNPAVATLPDGRIGVTFASKVGTSFRTKFRVLSLSGVGAFADKQVDSFAMPTAPAVSITVLSTGRFALAWDRSQTTTAGSPKDVYVARYTPAGAREGGIARVNGTVAKDQFDPSVAAFTNGRFVVGHTAPDSALSGIDARSFSSAGAPVNGSYFLNTVEARAQVQPSLAPLGTGARVLAVWTSPNQDGSGDGIYGRFIAAP